MIDSIKLENFQSHANSTLEFCPGINAITGESDNGKTAIIRALYLARYNKPSVDPLISKWARNDKGGQIEDMSVTVYKGENYLIRGKGKELNGYNVNGKVLEALGKGGLPQEVESFFNMSEVNIQQQMDTPFLLGQKPAEIARFLNAIVDMTDIDVYLSSIDSKKRATKKDIVRVKSEVVGLEKELKQYDDLDTISSVVAKLEKVQNRKSKYTDSLKGLKQSIDTYKDLFEKSSVWDNIVTIEGLLSKALPLSTKLAEKSYNTHKLTKSIKQYKALQVTLSNCPPTEKIIPLLKKMTDLLYDKEQLQKKKRALTDSIKDHKTSVKKVNRLKLTITKLTISLPSTCPTCNQPWEVLG